MANANISNIQPKNDFSIITMLANVPNLDRTKTLLNAEDSYESLSDTNGNFFDTTFNLFSDSFDPIFS